MGDEVKITVIATGFQRNHFPDAIKTEPKGAPRQQESPDTCQTVPAYVLPPEIVEYASQREAARELEPVTADIEYAAAAAVPEYSTAAAAGAQGPVAGPPQPSAHVMTPTAGPAPQPQDRRYDDIDLPAFLRRERKLFGRD